MIGIDAATMDRLPALKLVLCNGAGLDRIDLAEAERRGIEICNTPDAVTEDTADFAIALLYAARRRVLHGDRLVRAGLWGKQPLIPSRRLSASKVGVVGLGKIGGLVAQRLEALGVDIAYHTPREKPGLGYRYFADVTDLANWCDVLILCCPATPQTERLVDARVLMALGSDGTLINVARGSVVDEPALIRALETREIGCAALDVFASEPNPDPRLLALDNVILSPHAAAVTQETRRDMAETLGDRAARFFLSR